MLLAFSVSSLNITIYYGDGCPHCETTMNYLNQIKMNYTSKEVYKNVENLDELLKLYGKQNVSINEQGVPTTIINDNCMIIGEISSERWNKLIDLCKNECPMGVYNNKNIGELLGEENNNYLLYVLATMIIIVGYFILFNPKKVVDKNIDA